MQYLYSDLFWEAKDVWSSILYFVFPSLLCSFLLLSILSLDNLNYLENSS